MWKLTINSTPIPPAGIYADDRRARAIAALLVTMDQSAVIEDTEVFLRSGDNLAVITFVPQVAIVDVIDFYIDDHGREHRRFRADVLGTEDFGEQCWAVLALISSAEIQMIGGIPPLPDNLPPLPADVRRKPVKSSTDPDILRPIIKDWTRREKVKFSIRDLIDKIAPVMRSAVTTQNLKTAMDRYFSLTDRENPYREWRIEEFADELKKMCSTEELFEQNGENIGVLPEYIETKEFRWVNTLHLAVRASRDGVAIIVSGDFLDDDGDALSYGGTWTPDVQPEIQPEQIYRLDITYARLSWPVAGGKISKFCRGFISIPTPDRMREKMYPVTIDDGVAKITYGKREDESLVISPVIIQFSHMALQKGE